MDSELAEFLHRYPARAERHDTWAGGKMLLQVTAHLTSVIPPPAFITSIRAVVTLRGNVLVMRYADGEAHIIPGGRTEDGETFQETLRREVREETDWLIGSLHLLGCLHYHHLSPAPARYPHPYPDFIQLIYTAEAVRREPYPNQTEDHAMTIEFQQPAQLAALSLPPVQQIFIEDALRHSPDLDKCYNSQQIS